MNYRNRQWKVLESTFVLNNPWYKVRKDKVLLPNGVVIEDYFVSELKDVAMVFAITKSNDVVFVRQYRHPAKRVLLELPAGIYSRGESAKGVASLELLEETGYKAKKLTSLSRILEYPTKDSHKIHLFLAKDVILTKLAKPEATEDIEVVLIPINNLLKLVKDGNIFVGGTISCITKALLYLNEIDL